MREEDTHCIPISFCSQLLDGVVVLLLSFLPMLSHFVMLVCLPIDYGNHFKFPQFEIRFKELLDNFPQQRRFIFPRHQERSIRPRKPRESQSRKKKKKNIKDQN